MKFLLFIALNLILLNFSFAETRREKIVRCSLKHIPAAQAWINEQYYNSYDKFKHCAVSCYLDLRCPRGQVGLVGILKEVKDAFGPGNAELADIKADFYGLKLVRKKLASTDEDCARKCDEKYPKP
jgi:hypothetical protein